MLHAPTTTTPDLYMTDALTNALLELAVEAGYTSERDEVDEDDDTGEPIYAYLPSSDDLIRMARQPITAAALLYDLCIRMGETPPPCIMDALTDPQPF